MARVNVFVESGFNELHRTGAGSNYVVVTPGGVIYIVFLNYGSSSTVIEVKFTKSTDGGVTWSAPTTVSAEDTCSQLSIWYDRWSGIAAGLIHCAWTDTADGDDCRYRSIDTENSDSLSTQTVIGAFTSATAAGGPAISIVRARGGNLYCKVTVDAGAEGGFFGSTDVGANWSALTNSEALATTDQWILMPGWAADDDDIMMFFWDASVDEISRVLYDQSGDSWAETSISTAMVDVVSSSTFPHFAAAVDTTNSRNLLVAWSGVDTANADLRCWHITESAITEVTNVVLNSTDDQGLCAIGIDTDTQDWYVFYGGKSDGSETWSASAGVVKVYYKISTDDGATWGAETALTAGSHNLAYLCCNPRSSGFPNVLLGIGVGSTDPFFPVMNIAEPTAGTVTGISRARAFAGMA